MIIEKMWFTEERRYYRLTSRKTWRGWFLFGIIPLYIKMTKLEKFI